MWHMEIFCADKMWNVCFSARHSKSVSVFPVPQCSAGNARGLLFDPWGWVWAHVALFRFTAERIRNLSIESNNKSSSPKIVTKHGLVCLVAVPKTVVQTEKWVRAASVSQMS